MLQHHNEEQTMLTGEDCSIHCTKVQHTANSRIATYMMKVQRDKLLIETDWWAVTDRKMTQEQTAYRQALRDLPNTTQPELDENEFLTGIIWPIKPTE